MYTPDKEVMNVIALEVNQKYYTTSELKNMGYSYYKIGQMEENGQLHRINRTTYENLSYKGDENDFINAAAYVPDGVICLMSAARYYELTNFLPDVIDVAIYRLSVSPYASHFVLKGGIFPYAIFDRKYERATTDVDLLARRISNRAEEMKDVFRNIFAQDTDDALVFDLASITAEDIPDNALLICLPIVS